VAKYLTGAELALLARLRDGLTRIDGVTICCADDLADHVGLLTANMQDMDPGKVGAILDGDFDIAVRVGRARGGGGRSPKVISDRREAKWFGETNTNQREDAWERQS
jgi:selenocysteine lyase/cysteine desulfurase